MCLDNSECSFRISQLNLAEYIIFFIFDEDKTFLLWKLALLTLFVFTCIFFSILFLSTCKICLSRRIKDESLAICIQKLWYDRIKVLSIVSDVINRNLRLFVADDQMES